LFWFLPSSPLSIFDAPKQGTERKYMIGRTYYRSLRGWLLILGLLWMGAGHAQKSVADSLTTLIQAAKEDTTKVKLLYQLCAEYEKTDKEKAVQAGAAGLALAKKLEDKRLTAEGLSVVGDAYNYQGDFEKALNNYLKGLEAALAIGDSFTIASHSFNVGVAQYYLGNYEEAITYYLDAIGTFQEGGHLPSAAATINSIGNVYYSQGNYEKASQYYEEAVAIREQIGDSVRVVMGLNNLGLVAMHQGNYEQSIEYHMRALKLYSEADNEKGIGTSLSNIGLVYVELKNYVKALEYYQRSIDIRRDIGDQLGIVISLFNMGQVYMEQGKLDIAVDHLGESLQLARQIGDKEGVKYAYEYLALTYARKKQFEQAYTYYQQYIGIKDSLLNDETHRQIAELEARYQSKEQEKEIELLNKDKALQAAEIDRSKVMRNSLILGLALIVILAFVLLNRYKIKQRANKMLTLQKEEIAQKNHDITDSLEYAKTIQEGMLPAHEELAQSLPQHFVYFQPRDIVSGDFYWFHKDEYRVFLAVADCTGHGVPGALVSMVGNNLLNQIIVEQQEKDPGRILQLLNRYTIQTFKEQPGTHRTSDGMDISLCVIDQQKQQLSFAGANHPLLAMRKGQLEVITGDSASIGGATTADFDFTTHTVDFADAFYIFSDGYADQFGGPRGKKFMISNFKKLLQENAALPFTEQKQKLDDALLSWQGNNFRVDDILVMGFIPN